MTWLLNVGWALPIVPSRANLRKLNFTIDTRCQIGITNYRLWPNRGSIRPMQVTKTQKLTIYWTEDGLMIEHDNGAKVVIPMSRFESWLLRQIRGSL